MTDSQVATIDEGGGEVDAPTGGNAVTPMQMLQLAIERGADLDQMQRLMDLQERWEATNARKAFVTALNAFKANPPELHKDKTIKHNGRLISKYAGLDQISRTVGEALAKHGISHRWDTDQTDTAIRVTCILTHDLGHSEQTTLAATADTSGSKNSIQAIGSTITYLQRYTLLAATGMSVGDMDDDGQTVSDPISEAQKEELVEILKETGSNTAKFCAYMGVPSIDALPAARFNQARETIRRKKPQKGGAA